MSHNKKRQHRRRRRTLSRSNSPDNQAKITTKPLKRKKGRNNDKIGSGGSVVATTAAASTAVGQSSSSTISLCSCSNTFLKSNNKNIDTNKIKIDMLTSAKIDLNGLAQTKNRGQMKCICKCNLYECTITYVDGGIYNGSTKFVSLDVSHREEKSVEKENNGSNERMPKSQNDIKTNDAVILPIRDGHGVYIDKDENVHEGLWKNDYANGHGIKEFHTGDRHEGSYVEDRREGWGK